jgi:hypothetical protein
MVKTINSRIVVRKVLLLCVGVGIRIAALLVPFSPETAGIGAVIIVR